MEANNIAELREALENAHSLICEGIATEVDDEIEHPFHLELACEVIQKALAAKPRNCDIYTTEEAVDAATGTVRDCVACSRIDMEAPCVFCMVRWLLAPATVGGAK